LQPVPKASQNVGLPHRCAITLVTSGEQFGAAFEDVEATQGQIDGFLSQLATRIEWHMWEIDLRFASRCAITLVTSGEQFGAAFEVLSRK